MRSILMALLVLFVSPAVDARGADALNEQEFRVVSRDGDQRFGALQFAWTTFDVKKSRGAGDGEGGDGGGRGGRGGRGGVGAGLGLNMIQTLVDGDATKGLFWIDRIELDGQVVMRASSFECRSPLVDDVGYTAAYGGLALPFKGVPGWQAVLADDLSLTLVRRDQDDAIVGALRLGIHRFGNGEKLDLELDPETIDVDAVLREVDRLRFDHVDDRGEKTHHLADGSAMHVVHRVGAEVGSLVPLTIEAWFWTLGPFLPRVDVMARGADRDAVLAESRLLLDAVRFTKDEPAPRRRDVTENDDGGQGRDDGGRDGGREGGRDGGRGNGGGRGGRGGGGGMFAGLIDDALEDDDSEFLTDGRYVNPRLGVEFRSKLPKDWTYLRADETGLLAIAAPSDARGFELAAVGLTVLDGSLAVDKPEVWLAERYLTPGTEGKAPRPKKTRLGNVSAYKEEVEQDLFRNRALQRRFFIDDRGRTVVLTSYGSGSGTRAESLLKPLTKWLKSLKLSTPEG